MMPLIVAFTLAWPCPAQTDDALTTSNPGETTWEWIARNHLPGIPVNSSIEIEPNKPLIATHPFTKPKPGDKFYDAKKEAALGTELSDGTLVRLYRRGVFIGYTTIRPANSIKA